MNLLLTLRVALRALAKNKMRAGLTVLGVVIGVAAVTTMVSIGQSAGNLVQNELQGIGTNVLIVLPGSRKQNGVHGGHGTTPTLTAEDSDAIVGSCPSILAASPIVMCHQQVICGGSNWSPNQIVGVTDSFMVVRSWELRAGGFFTDRDVTSAAKVCVLGQTVAEKLFQTASPIGAEIRIKNIPFRVVGLLRAKGANMVGEDQDDVILAPYTTIRSRLRGNNFDKVDVILCSARSPKQMDDAASEIRELLQQRHHIGKGDLTDFDVQTTTEIANVLGVVTGTMTALLASIAGISLLVGGVGIMNIMLVSVTERTREIGIRMAVGARPRDILRQFLIEAVLLSVIGGMVGFALGVGASIWLTALINSWTSGTKWPTTVSMTAAVVAILFAAAVGVFFGYYPARRASRLDPIEALRYE